MDTNKKSIYYLFGTFPPPLGGVSVFIYRFSKDLIKKGYDVKNIDFSKHGRLWKISFLLTHLVKPQKGIYHLNGLNFYVILMLLIRSKDLTIIFQDHSGRQVAQLKGLKWVLFNLFSKKINECILVGSHLEKYYRNNGFVLPLDTKVQNAFLPPPPEDEKKILKSYERSIFSFVEHHRPLLIANAYQIVFYKNTDLYGIDLCVELVFKLKRVFPDIGLILGLADIGERSYFQKIQSRINELNIQDNFYFLTGQKELWPLFKKADLMIRPTSADGYGISIAEALYFGCPAIASDVCARPEGTQLFKNRNIDDLYKKSLKLLKHHVKSKSGNV